MRSVLLGLFAASVTFSPAFAAHLPPELYFYASSALFNNSIREGEPLAVSPPSISNLFPAISGQSGVILMISWNQLCPVSPDTCDFSFVDSVLNYWGQRGKKVVLNVTMEGFPFATLVNGVGAYVSETPAWVLKNLQPTASNPTDGTCRVTPRQTIGKLVNGTIAPELFPAYWDERFVTMAKNFAAQLAQRYDGNPVISAVRIPYGVVGEENPMLLGFVNGVLQYPAGFTFKNWEEYNRKLTQIT